MGETWKIIHFQTSRGEFPVDTFLDSLSLSTGSKAVRMLDTLAQYGYQVRMPYAKQLDKNLYELRIRGKQEVRIFYAFFRQNIVLLHAFIKKTRQTPSKEITVASSRLVTCNT